MILTLQSHVISIAMVTVVVSVLFVIANRALVKFAEDPLQKPEGIVLVSLLAVDMIDGLCYKNLHGNEEIKDYLGPYVGMLWAYILLSNIWGLTGFDAPTCNFSVTLTLAVLTIAMVEINSFKYNGAKNYLHALIEPVFVFLPMNIISKFAPIVSLSMRLFANMLSGTIIMTLLYAAMSYFTGLIIPGMQFNILGVVVAPVLHSYFDLISGLLQTFIFTTLTMIFIGKELPGE